MDYYKAYGVLGLVPGAPFTEVKKAYRDLTLSLHPDNHPQEEQLYHERYLEVREAFEFLEEAYKAQNIMSAYCHPVKTGGRILGGNVAYVHSQEKAAERARFEKRMKAEQEARKQRLQAELEERQKKLREEKQRKEKEKYILNEIRMIRLAHAIESVLTEEALKNKL